MEDDDREPDQSKAPRFMIYQKPYPHQLQPWVLMVLAIGSVAGIVFAAWLMLTPQ